VIAATKYRSQDGVVHRILSVEDPYPDENFSLVHLGCLPHQIWGYKAGLTTEAATCFACVAEGQTT